MKRPRAFGSRIVAREPQWELRQVTDNQGEPVGDLVLLYREDFVRALLVLDKMPPEREWESLDSWVLSQIDLAGRSYQIDYMEGRFVTGLEGEATDG